MPLGNPVRFNTIPERPIIMIAANLDLRDNQPFWRRKIFDMPRSGLFGWLFNRRSLGNSEYPWIVGGSPDPTRRKGKIRLTRGSVDEVLFSITDTINIGTANGSEAVEVAFQHLTFISGPGGACDTASEQGLEQRITKSLSSTLKGYFDPTIGIRVEWTCPGKVEGLSVSFGNNRRYPWVQKSAELLVKNSSGKPFGLLKRAA